MNKFSKLFAGFAAVAMLASCSNNEPDVPGVPETPADGEVAYMAITIKAPQTGMPISRVTTPGDYVESDLTELEHAVSSVDFYFFNDDGAYAFNAKADDTSFVPADGDATNAGNGNVEYIGSKNILILNGVRQNNYPEYVITVLNKPADFAPGQTLQETAEKLATFANDFTREKPFVMTTSSFLGDKNGLNGEARHDAKYFATKLNKSDFKTTVSDAQGTKTPVEIYVERLAAKVEVGLGGSTDKDGYYQLTGNTTLGGGNNQTENGDGVSDVQLYVKVIDWRLNATAKQSYMSKILDADEWAKANALWNNWNKPDDWRSFWAKAQTYGADPEGKLTYKTPAQITAGTNGLGFSSQNQGNIEYCYENTNNPNNIFKAVDGGSLSLNGTKVGVENAKVTHVVLHTQIFQKVTKDGVTTMEAPSLVQYRGVLFTEDSYKAMLLNQLKAAGDLNFWHYTGESATPGSDLTTSNWKTIDTNDFKMEGDRGKKLGQIKIVAKALENGEKIYERVEHPAEGTEGEEGYKPAYTEYVDITDTYVDTVNGLIAKLEAANPAVGSDTAEAFYFIPVEHLAAAVDQSNAVEGYYGVVRNHWYKITINSFKKVGHLVFDPDNDTTTPVKPEGPEDPLYYVGANINILSWKVVNQTVTDL